MNEESKNKAKEDVAVIMYQFASKLEQAAKDFRERAIAVKDNGVYINQLDMLKYIMEHAPQEGEIPEGYVFRFPDNYFTDIESLEAVAAGSSMFGVDISIGYF